MEQSVKEYLFPSTLLKPDGHSETISTEGDGSLMTGFISKQTNPRTEKATKLHTDIG